jgi:hypothetical protein
MTFDEFAKELTKILDKVAEEEEKKLEAEQAEEEPETKTRYFKTLKEAVKMAKTVTQDRHDAVVFDTETGEELFYFNVEDII